MPEVLERAVIFATGIGESRNYSGMTKSCPLYGHVRRLLRHHCFENIAFPLASEKEAIVFDGRHSGYDALLWLRN